MKFAEYLRLTESVNTVQPKNLEELKEIIKDTIEEKGPYCDLNFINTSKITDMRRVFRKSAFNGDISKWDVSNVKNMINMFCSSEFNGDISKWDVSKVEDTSFMFCSSVFNGDISEWDVFNVVNMADMFSLSKFNGDRKSTRLNSSH